MLVADELVPLFSGWDGTETDKENAEQEKAVVRRYVEHSFQKEVVAVEHETKHDESSHSKQPSEILQVRPLIDLENFRSHLFDRRLKLVCGTHISLDRG